MGDTEAASFNTFNTFFVSPNPVGFFRDQIWQFVGAIFGLIAIVTGVVFFYQGQSRKELQIAIVSAAPLFNVRSEEAENISVNYKGINIQSAMVMQIQIKNTGNQAIKKDDFSRVLSFEFGRETQIIDYIVVKSEPDDVGMVLTRTLQNRVEALPVLLNPEDTVDIRFIVIGQDYRVIANSFLIGGRIEGVKEIKVSKVLKRALERGDVISYMFFVSFLAQISFISIVCLFSLFGLRSVDIGNFVASRMTFGKLLVTFLIGFFFFVNAILVTIFVIYVLPMTGVPPI